MFHDPNEKETALGNYFTRLILITKMTRLNSIFAQYPSIKVYYNEKENINQHFLRGIRSIRQ